MSNLAKLDFEALDISGKNYLSWILDAEMHLDANGLGETIKEENKESSQNKVKAMILLRHHLQEALKSEYLTVKDPQVLWNNLKDRYDHQNTVMLPRARFEWLNLRLQDFKSVSDYNSAMFRITSQMKLCGEKINDAEMLQKTYSTFHAQNLVLQTQYREKGFKKHSELISCLLVAEQNNELLLKNHESRPTGSTPFPEANVTFHNDHARSRGRGRGANRSRGRGYGYGRGRGYGYGRGRSRGVNFKNSYYPHQKWVAKEEDTPEENYIHENVSTCICCGGTGHWSRVCRTPRHLIEPYQASLKQKNKKIKTNMVVEDAEGDFDSGNITHMEASDFYTSNDENN